MKNEGSKRARWALPLILSFLGLAILTRLFYPGQILGLDYNLYYPDGVCYTSHAYQFAGLNPTDAWDRTISEYTGVDAKYQSLSSDLKTQSCQSLQARIIYPLLSAPFVLQLGLKGMLIIPILSVMLSMIFIFFTLRRLRVNEVSIVIGLLALAASSTFLRWNIANLPENLLLLWASISAYMLIRFFSENLSKNRNQLYFAAFVILIILSALTKRSAHFWTIILLSLTITYLLSPDQRAQLRKPSLYLPAGSLLLITWLADRLIGKFLGAQNSLWIATTTASCVKGENVSVDPGNVTAPLSCNQLTRNALRNIWNFVVNEIGQLAVLDKPLFLLSGAIIIGVIAQWRALGSIPQFCLLVSLLTFGATTLNATLGLNFRLMTPALPYLIIGAVAVIDHAISKVKVRI